MRPKKKKYSPVLIVTGGIIVIILAYYCASGMHPGETVFDWQRRMQNILEQPFNLYFNSYTGKTVLVFLFIYALAVLMYITSRRNYLPGREMGSAQYADVKKVNQKLADLSKDIDDPQNIVVINHRRRRIG